MRLSFVLTLFFAMAYMMPAHGAHLCIDLFQVPGLQTAVTSHQQKFYEKIAEKIDPRSFAVSEYGPERASEILQKLSVINPSYTVLVADFGIVTHLDLFARFVRLLQLKDVSPWQAAKEFRAASLKKKVYRGLSLTDLELKLIQREGLDSNFLRKLGFANLNSRLNEIKARGLVRTLQNRLGDQRKVQDDIFLSVSDHADIAAAVAGLYYPSKVRTIYVFEIEVPEVDLIKVGGASPLSYPPVLQRKVENGLQSKIVSYDGRSNIYNFGSAVETFLSYHIDRSAILAVYRVEPHKIPTYLSTYKLATPAHRPNEDFLRTLTSLW